MTVTQTNLLDTSVATKLEKRFVKFTLRQDTLLCQTSFSSIAEESVQAHFTNKNHWVCRLHQSVEMCGCTTARLRKT